MAILGERERSYLRSKFEKELSGKVRLIVFTQEFECEYCAEARGLAEEIAELDNRISVEVHDFQSEIGLAERLKVDKIPALLVFGEKEYGIRFFGIPSGYEFMTLVDDIIQVSKGSSSLPAILKEKIRQIDRPIHIQVFVTPTCPYCPIAVRTAHQMAMENPNITSDMVEILEFPHLAQRYQVMAVPKVVINDKVSFEGALPESVFVEYVLAAVKG